MKKLSLLRTFGVFFLASLAVSCSDDDVNSGPSENLVEVAQEQTSLSTFVQALEAAGLSNAYQGSVKYTVFAPTNGAWDTWLLENGYSGISAVPTETLKQLIYNHTLSGSIETPEMITGYVRTLATGPASESKLSMFIDVQNQVKVNGISTLTTPNLEAKNGMLHIVDKVIGLPTIMTHLRANPELSSLNSGLGFNSASGFVSTLSGTSGAPFTVFAPTNTAFSSFFTETGNASFAAFEPAALETALEYHVLQGTNLASAAFASGQSYGTLANQNFTITLTGGGKKITDINNRVSNIVKTDIQATNGIVHMIDKTLLPNL